MFLRTAYIFCCSVLFLVFTLMPFSFAQALDGSIDSIKQKGTLKICTEAGYIPLEMKSSSGKWLGFDIEMIQDFAHYLGVKLEIADTKWDGIIPAVLSGKCSAIASSMAMTEERARVLSFSEPYFSNEIMAAARVSLNQKIINNILDLNVQNITIAVKTGSSADLYLQRSHVLKNAHITKYDADADTVGAVLTGKADAFIYDKPYVNFAKLKYPSKLKVLEGSFSGDSFGVAFRKQDSELREAFNKFLDSWKKSGSFEKVYSKYFQRSDWIQQLDK